MKPGTILILLAGRFRGKRVVLLKHLEQGVLLITGPFKANGVPLRRVNARYVIATSKQVELKGVDEKVLEKASQPDYFGSKKEKTEKKKNEEAFFKQGEKPEVRKISNNVDRWRWRSQCVANSFTEKADRKCASGRSEGSG